MLGFLAVSGLALALAQSPDSTPAISRATFESWFDSAASGGLDVPPRVVGNALRYQYVFISGLRMGSMQGYLVQNTKELRASGVPREAIHLIEPSSHKTVAENARQLREEMREIAANDPRPLVVIAHSRGACDALAFAIQNPKFVSRRVHALFLIQGPFGGSGVADYVAGEGPEMDGLMPAAYRVIGKTAGKLESVLVRKSKRNVISSLSRETSNRFWSQLLDSHPEAIAVVSPKTFYITSQTKTRRHPLLQQATASYLETYYGPNDGMVSLDDQCLPDLGTVVAELDAGHTDLTHKFPSARPRAKLRKAVVNAIFMAAGSLPVTCQPARPTTDRRLTTVRYRTN